MAFLDQAVAYGNCVIVGGPEHVRRSVADAVKELASNQGRVFKVSTVGTLRGIIIDETPFEATDYVLGMLDSRDADYLKEFFNLADTGRRVRCIGEASETRLADFVRRLDELEVSRQYLKNDTKVYCSVAYAGWGKSYLKSITEIVGVEKETNELITNGVYTIERSGEDSQYTGHSFMLERIAQSEGKIMNDVKKYITKSTKAFSRFVPKKK
jgi:hypothetical protein